MTTELLPVQVELRFGNVPVDTGKVESRRLTERLDVRLLDGPDDEETVEGSPFVVGRRGAWVIHLEICALSRCKLSRKGGSVKSSAQIDRIATRLVGE